jgi:hypothetical protein
LGAADVLLPDTYQGGSILAVKKVATLAEAAGVPCVFHCSHDLGLKTAAMLHVVASTPNFLLANDCTYYGLEADIITSPHRIDWGYTDVPEEPGLGLNVNKAKLARYRVCVDAEELAWGNRSEGGIMAVHRPIAAAQKRLVKQRSLRRGWPVQPECHAHSHGDTSRELQSSNPPQHRCPMRARHFNLPY